MRLNETLLRCCLPPSPVFPDGLYILTFAIPLNVLLFPLPPHFKQNLPTNTGNSLTKLGCMFLFHQLELWEQEETINISSESISFSWSLKNFINLSSDQKLLEVKLQPYL